MLQQLAAMLLRRHTHLGQNCIRPARGPRHRAAFRVPVRLFRLKSLDDLVEEKGYPMIQLFFGGSRGGSLRDFHPASLD